MIRTTVVGRYTPSTHNLRTPPDCVHSEFKSSLTFLVLCLVRLGLFFITYQSVLLTNVTPALSTLCFIFKLTEYSCNDTYDIFFLETPRLFLEHECIFCGYTSRCMTQSTRLMTSLEQLIHFHILLNSFQSVLEIIELNKSEIEN